MSAARSAPAALGGPPTAKAYQPLLPARPTGRQIHWGMLEGTMTSHHKAASDDEPAPQWLGWLESSTTFEDLVEEQGVRPFVWPGPLAEEDRFDVDEFLRAIFGEGMKR